MSSTSQTLAQVQIGQQDRRSVKVRDRSPPSATAMEDDPLVSDDEDVVFRWPPRSAQHDGGAGVQRRPARSVIAQDHALGADSEDVC